METLSFEAGQFLIRQGEQDTHAFIIESGSVKILIQDGSSEQILGVLSAGEVVGEMAFIDKAPRSASVIALEPTRVKKMTRQELSHALEKDPGAAMPFIKAVLDRLRTGNAMLSSATQTKNLIRKTRVRLKFEPVSAMARVLCQAPLTLELDVLPDESHTHVREEGLGGHFKITLETSLPDMQK